MMYDWFTECIINKNPMCQCSLPFMIKKHSINANIIYLQPNVVDKFYHWGCDYFYVCNHR